MSSIIVVSKQRKVETVFVIRTQLWDALNEFDASVAGLLDKDSKAQRLSDQTITKTEAGEFCVSQQWSYTSSTDKDES